MTVTLKFFVLYQVKSYHMSVEQIERELNDIETNLAQLEKDGVELEKKLRSCEEGTCSPTLPPFFLFRHPNKIECGQIRNKLFNLENKQSQTARLF